MSLTAHADAPTTPQKSATSAANSQAAHRDPFLDNARYWVMLLVVVGHVLTALIDEVDAARAVYRWIYLFHMPVFILISGYTARNYSGSPRQVRRMVGTLVVPYLLVEFGLEVVEAWLAGETLSLHLLEPTWLTWFIAALFVWRLTTPIWQAIRWPVPVAVACSLIGGLAPVSDVLAIPQIIGYLPFYVAGMQLRREHFDRLRDWRVRIVSAVALAIAGAVCVLEPKDWLISWLYWRDAYAEAPLYASPLDGMADRAAIMVLGFVLAAAALALVPHGQAWYSRMGQRTLYCYLLHGFVILWLEYYGAFEYLGARGGIGLTILVISGLALANLLMTRGIAEGFRPVFEPKLRWLFRSDSPSKDPEPSR